MVNERQQSVQTVIAAVAVVVIAAVLPARAGAIIAGLLVIDRMLLALERKGIMNYRRKGLSRGAATYHALELGSIYNPGFHEVMEVQYTSEQMTDEDGGPQ